MEGNLLYSQRTDLNVDLIHQTPSPKHPEQCWSKYLGTVPSQADTYNESPQAVIMNV